VSITCAMSAARSFMVTFSMGPVVPSVPLLFTSVKNFQLISQEQGQRLSRNQQAELPILHSKSSILIECAKLERVLNV
jgi:hypothetical protein